MKKLLLLYLFLFPLSAFAQTVWMPVTYTVTTKIRNRDIALKERFTSLKTDFRFSPDKLETSHFKARIHVATAEPESQQNQSEEKYLDSGKYKTVDIESIELYAKGANYAGKFNVIVNGVVSQVEIPFEFNQTGDEAEFRAGFNINANNFPEGIKTLTMNEPAHVSIYIKAKG